MAGQMIAIHEAYLTEWKAKNPNVIQPTLVPYAEILPLCPSDPYKVITRACKYWNSFGDVKQLSDGRVAEFGDTVWTREAAVFPSYQAWMNYRKPMTIREHFERW